MYLNTLIWPVAALGGFVHWGGRNERPLNAAVARLLVACELVGLLLFARSLAGGLHPHAVANLLRLLYVPICVLAGLSVYRSIHELLDIAVVALGVKGVVLIVQMVSAGPVDIYHRLRVDALGGPNIFAAMLVTVVLLRVSTWLFDDRPPGRLVLASLVIGCLCVLLTFSRGAAVSLGVGAIALGAMLLRGRGHNAKVWLLLSVLVVPFVPNSPVHARLTELSVAESSGRTKIWQPAFDGFDRSPLVGNGFGSFEASSESFGDTANAKAVPVTYSAHNLPLQVLFETGLVGLIVVVVASGALLQRCWHPVLLPTAAAMAVHAMFETMPYVVQTSWIYGIVLAVGLSSRERKKASAPRRDEAPAPKPRG